MGTLFPRELVVAASHRHAVVPDTDDPFVIVHDTRADLGAGILAPFRRQERDGHEILVPVDVRRSFRIVSEV